MDGYRLSASAARQEARWGGERKSVVGSFGPTGPMPGRQDANNFISNRVTLAEYDDRQVLNDGAALGLAATWACVNLLAGTISSLPLMVYRTSQDGRREVARDHPLYRLLHDRPNYDQTALDFLEFVCLSLELHGNGFARKEMASGRLVSLVPVRPDGMTIKRTADGSLQYRWLDGGREFIAGQDEMLHIRGPGGGPLGGASTLSVCREIFGGSLAVDRASGTMFRNGVRPSGVLSTATPLKPEQRQLAEQLLQEKFVGAVNAGRPMLLDNGLTWTQLTIDPADAQMLESRKFSGEEICRIFGIPPAMVGYGDKASNWGTGKEQDVLGFQKFTLRRRLKRVEMAMEQQLLTAADRVDGIVIEFNQEGILRGDSAARATFYQSGLTNGWLTINEVRGRENLPPVEGGNVPRMQSQNVPITMTPAITDPAMPATADES